MIGTQLQVAETIVATYIDIYDIQTTTLVMH